MYQIRNRFDWEMTFIMIRLTRLLLFYILISNKMLDLICVFQESNSVLFTLTEEMVDPRMNVQNTKSRNEVNLGGI